MSRIAVSWGIPVAGVSYAAPEMVVSVTLPTASITCTIPEVAPWLDDRGLHSIALEKTQFLDFAVFVVDKPVTELFNISDLAVLSVSLNKQDGITIGDTFSKICSFVRTFPDGAGFSDTQTFSVNKALTETANFTDVLTQSVNKPVSDTTTFSDSASRSVSKTCADSFAFTESFTMIGGNTYCSLDYFGENYVTSAFTI